MSRNVLCDECSGLCCRYFAFAIDTPETQEDYDDIRWFLCHKGITVFVEDGDWYINIKNKCRHLIENGRRCAIYSKRPRLCRTYSTKNCDYTDGEYEYELHFVNDKQMEEYMQVKFGNNHAEKPRRKKRRKSKVKVGC